MSSCSSRFSLPGEARGLARGRGRHDDSMSSVAAKLSQLVHTSYYFSITSSL